MLLADNSCVEPVSFGDQKKWFTSQFQEKCQELV